MQKAEKERIIQMTEEGIFDAELLVNCIAKLNKKITRKYQNAQHLKGIINLAGHDVFYAESVEELNALIAYRKPILDALMKTYRFSLDEVKMLAKKAKYEDLPTYQMIDAVRERILSGAFICT